MQPMVRIMVFDRLDNYLFDIDPMQVIDLPYETEINGEHSLTIKTTQELDKTNRLVIRDGMGIWHEYVVLGIVGSHQGTKKVINEYYCVWSLQYDLMGTFINGPYECGLVPGHASIPQLPYRAMEVALGGTERWQIGTITVTNMAAASFYRRSGWEGLQTVIEKWGGEIQATITVDGSGVVTRSVDLLEHVGNSVATRRFDYGHDMVGIKRTVSDEIWPCRIVPLGKATETDKGGYTRRPSIESVNDGVMWVQDDEVVPYVAVLGPHGNLEYPTVIVENDVYEQPADLLAWAQDNITDYTRPKVSYEAEVAQFEAAGLNAHGVSLGDEIVAVDKTFNDDGLRISARVVKIKGNMLDPADLTLTIGNSHETLAGQLSGISKRMGQITGDLDRVAQYQSTADYLAGLLARFNQEVNQTGGYFYVVDGEGAYTYDAEVSDPTVGDEASQVVQIKGGNIRIANSRTPSGEWDFKTLLQSGHILSELVTAAQLVAGHIGSANSGNYWNLDTGDFRMAGTAQIGGRTVTQLLNSVDANITGVDVQYAENQSQTVAPTTGWSTTAPAWRAGYYIWQRTATVTPNGTQYSNPVCISGRNGADGRDGRNLLRKTGSITSSDLVLTRSSVPEDGIIRLTPTTLDASAKFKVNYLDYGDYASDTYTLSADVRLAPVESSQGEYRLLMYLGVNASSRIADDLSSSYDRFGYVIAIDSDEGQSLTSDWQRVSATFSVPDSFAWGPESVLTAGNYLTARFLTHRYCRPIEIRHVKLERGARDTGWTAAPEDLIGVQSVVVEYGTSSAASTEPTGWGTDAPTALPKGTWLWVRTTTTFTDDSTRTTYSKSYIGTDGEDGTSVYVQSSTKVDGRTTLVIADSDGNTTTLRIDDGTDGTNGTPGLTGYVHIAWANSADGSVDFSTSTSTGKTYVGVYTDHSEPDSTRYQDYSWSLIKGEAGEDGISIKSVVEEYYLSTSNTTQTGGSWSETCPEWVRGKYIWTRSRITWDTDPVTTTTTTPVLANGLNKANQTASDASVAVNNLQSQQAIFNLLTNNGALPGLFMSGGQLYINANYLHAGVISSLDGQSYWDLEDNLFQMLGDNAANMYIGIGDGNGNLKSGVTIEDGLHYKTQYGETFNVLPTGGHKRGQATSGGEWIDYTNTELKVTNSYGNAGVTITTGGTLMSPTADIRGDGPLRINSSSEQITFGANRGSAYGNTGTITLNAATIALDAGTTHAGGRLTANSKNRLLLTKHYGNRLLYCYETPSPMFGDVGSGTTDEHGECVIAIDDIFAETMRTDYEYQVFLQPCGNGSLYVSEKHPTHFVVMGTPNLPFDWELKGRQIDFETERLEEYDVLRAVETERTDEIVSGVLSAYDSLDEYVRAVEDMVLEPEEEGTDDEAAI